MVVLGGVGSIAGVVAGAITLSVVNSYLLPDVLFDLPSKVGLAFNLSSISSGIYGAILLVVMLLRPQGLVGEAQPAVTARAASGTARHVIRPAAAQAIRASAMAGRPTDRRRLRDPDPL